MPRDGHPADGLELTPVASMPASWAAPRLLDRYYTQTFQRNAQTWQRSGKVIVPPHKRIMIGPRFIGIQDAPLPTTSAGLTLSIDGQPVDLAAYPLTPPETYVLGALNESYFGDASGEVSFSGIAADTVAAGSYLLQTTSVLAVGSELRPWSDEIQLIVRPYLRNEFAATPPAPLPRAGGLRVVQPSATVLRNVTVISGAASSATVAAVLPDAAVVIDGEWIVGVGPVASFDLSAGPATIDGQGGYVIPGIINAHVHYTSELDLPPKDWLDAGVTTLVDAGGRLLAVLSVRESFAADSSPQPDLMVAGPILLAPGLDHISDYGSTSFSVASDAGAAGAAALAAAEWGVNLLKLNADSLSTAQIQAVTKVGRQRDLKVMAHAITAAGLGRAIAGGVDSVTHTPPLSSAHIQQMVAAGVILIPTLSATYRGDAAVADVANAFAAGVPIAMGNDASAGNRRGLPSRELQKLEQAGLSTLQVLEAATRRAAAVVGMDSVVGTVQAGKIADLVVLGADPLANLSNLADVKWVFKRGKVAVRP